MIGWATTREGDDALGGMALDAVEVGRLRRWTGDDGINGAMGGNEEHRLSEVGRIGFTVRLDRAVGIGERPFAIG